MKSKVVIMKTTKYHYPSAETMFRPGKDYPEYLFHEDISDQENEIYELIRNGFHEMGLDEEKYGTTEWNPLGTLIQPGNVVVLKPNMVMDKNPTGEGCECLYTQPSVIAPVIDYVLIALKGRGEIIVGDAPMQECDFDNLIATSGYQQMYDYYQDKIGDIKLSLVDFRDLKAERVDGVYHQKETAKKEGIEVHLDDESEFAGEDERFYKDLRITNYDPEIMEKHHNQSHHDYYVSKTILRADVIINLPKPKTHRKAGVTIALKNLVGINARKEYLPHHSIGAKQDGGDEYQDRFFLKSLRSKVLDKRNAHVAKAEYGKAKLWNKLEGYLLVAARPFKKKDTFFEGSWYGNDTISKTIVDLNKILLYADKEGNVTSKVQRKFLIIADMIISGEKEGPLLPSPKEVGIIAMGDNPVSFDEVIGTIMGADISRIPTFVHARKTRGTLKIADYDSVEIVSNDSRWNGKQKEEFAEDAILHYIPTSGWKEVFK